MLLLEHLDRQVALRTQIAGMAIVMGAKDVVIPDVFEERAAFDRALDAEPRALDPHHRSVLHVLGVTA